MILKCLTCVTYKNCQPGETYIKLEIPEHPWTKFAANLFHLQGHYLLIVDHYLKFIAVENLRNPQSETVINKCKKVFSQFGITQGANYGQWLQMFQSQILFIFKNLGHTAQND